MSQTGDNLVVRQHERLNCRLRADISVAPEHAEQIVLSSASGETGGVITATVSDISTGGIGLQSSVFFPKQARLRVRLASDITGGEPLDTIVRVQRVQMRDRAPSYYLGTSFVDAARPGAARIGELMRTLRAASAPGAAA